MNRNGLQSLSNNYTYVSRECVLKSISCQDTQSTDTSKVLMKLNQLDNLTSNIPQTGYKVHKLSEYAIEIMLYFCIAELETIDTQSKDFEWVFFRSCLSAKAFTKDGCDYIILLGEIINLIGKLYPNKFQVIQLQDVLSLVFRAKEDVKLFKANNLRSDSQISSYAVYFLNKIICSNLSLIVEINHLDYLQWLVSSVDEYYKDIRPKLLAAILSETETEIKVHDVEGFKCLILKIEEIMSNASIAKIDKLDLLARVTKFDETPNSQEFYQLVKSIQNVCDRCPSEKRVLLEKLKLPTPQSVIEYIDIVNYIKSSRIHNHIHIYTERIWILQLQLPATHNLHEFKHLYMTVEYLMTSSCDDDVKDQLVRKLFSRRVIPADIYRLSRIIVGFFGLKELKGITHKLIRQITNKIISSYNLKISVRSLLNILSLCVVDIRILFLENENPKMILLDFINKICSQTSIVKPSTNIECKLGIWLEWIYSDCFDVVEHHWFDDSRVQRGNLYGLCHSHTMEHLLVKISKRTTSISDSDRKAMASIYYEKYKMPYLNVFTRDFSRYTIGQPRLSSYHNKQAANFGYRYSGGITFVRDQFSNIVKDSIAEFMYRTNSDLLITKLHIPEPEHMSCHFTFFSVGFKEVFGHKYYSLEYYDSEYDKTGTYGKPYAKTCITQDDISSYQNYISYTQHLLIPVGKLTDTTIPCPFASTYGDYFTMIFYI